MILCFNNYTTYQFCHDIVSKRQVAALCFIVLQSVMEYQSVGAWTPVEVDCVCVSGVKTLS